MKVRTKGLLFDMDGVLVSSLGSVERSWQTWAEGHGLDVRETIKTAHGMRAIETCASLKPDADHAAELKVIEELEMGTPKGSKSWKGCSRFFNRYRRSSGPLSPLPPSGWHAADLRLPVFRYRSTLSPPTW